MVASVQVLDHGGKPLPANHFEVMDLQPKLDIQSRRYITIAQLDSKDPYTALFTVNGVALGTARLSFVAQAQRGTTITSNVEDVQVRWIVID